MKPKRLTDLITFRIDPADLVFIKRAAELELLDMSTWCRQQIVNRARAVVGQKHGWDAERIARAVAPRPVVGPGAAELQIRKDREESLRVAHALAQRAREEAERASAVPPSLPAVVWDEPAPDGAPLAGPGSDEERQAEAHARAARLAADLAMIPVDDDAEGDGAGETAPTAGEGGGALPFEEPAQGQVREAEDF